MLVIVTTTIVFRKDFLILTAQTAELMYLCEAK